MNIIEKYEANGVTLEKVLNAIKEDLTDEDTTTCDHEKELLEKYIQQRFDVLPFF